MNLAVTRPNRIHTFNYSYTSHHISSSSFPLTFYCWHRCCCSGGSLISSSVNSTFLSLIFSLPLCTWLSCVCVRVLCFSAKGSFHVLSVTRLNHTLSLSFLSLSLFCPVSSSVPSSTLPPFTTGFGDTLFPSVSVFISVHVQYSQSHRVSIKSSSVEVALLTSPHPKLAIYQSTQLQTRLLCLQFSSGIIVVVASPYNRVNT